MMAVCLAIFSLSTTAVEAQELLNPVDAGTVQTVNDAPWQALFGEFAPISERIRVSGDDFVTNNDVPIKLFGTTIFGEAVFVDSLLAIEMAQRMASLGINSVRITGHDFTWNPAASIFKPIDQSQVTELDEASMRRFDWLFYQLKQHGIYVHLMLQNYRQALPQDGVEGWTAQPGQLRIAKFIDPQIEALDRRVARMLLEHVNPFTGMAYKDDPALAWVDVTDDKSLFNAWSSNSLTTAGMIGDYYVEMMNLRWHEFLGEKYVTEAAIENAWASEATSTENQVTNPGFEDPFAADWQLIAAGEGTQVVSDPFSTDRVSGEYSMRLRVNNGSNDIGLVQLRNSSILLEAEKLYEMRFHAKSEPAGKTIAISLINPAPPFQNYGINAETFTLIDEWTEYTFQFRATDDDDLGALLIIFAGGDNNDLLIDDVSITMISEPGLAQGESLAEGTIAQVAPDAIATSSPQRVRDYMQFLTELMKGHYNRMRSFVQDEIGSDVLVGAPTISTLANDIFAQSDLDYTGNNAAWDFILPTAEGPWTLQNSSSLNVPWGGLAALLGRGAMINKPHVVSRINMPFPNMNQHEMLSVWPVYAAYQDWDGMYLAHFAANSASLSSPNIQMNDWYSYAALPHITSLLPAISAAYRRGLISVAEEDIAIQQTQEALLYPAKQVGFWWMAGNADPRLPLFRRIGIESFDAEFQTLPTQLDVFELSNGDVNTADLRSDTDEISWNADDVYLTVNTPGYKAVSGIFGGELIELDDWSFLRLDDGISGAVSLISLDEDADLADAETAMLTLSTRTLNAGAVWNAQNTSIYNNWGDGNIQMEPMRMELLLESDRDSMLIQPLNLAGEALAAEAIVLANTGGFFRVTIDQADAAAYWYVITLKDEVTSTDITDESVLETQASIQLMTEHPASGVAVLRLDLPQPGVYELQVLSMQGLRQATIRGEAGSGSVIERLDTRNMAAGVYLLQLSSAAGIVTESIVVQR